jgi:hypothetical protein
MDPTPLREPLDWARQTFGTVALGDRRRPRRAIELAASMLANPAASLPRQTANRSQLKAAYRLLHEPDVTHQALLTPHWQQTRQAAGSQTLVLLTADLTTLDYSHHPTTTGLGPIGDGRGRGYLVHSVLAQTPAPRQVLGLAHQIPYVPKPKIPGETLRQQQARRRQTDVWQEAVAAIGSPPARVRWVHVGDRGSDIFRFLVACRQQGCDFLVRAAKNRRIEEGEGSQERSTDPTAQYLFTAARSWPAQGSRTIHLAGGHGLPTRDAVVSIAWRRVRLLPPRQEPGDGIPLEAWVLRVWEEQPPPKTKRPVDWVLITSVPVEEEAAVWERVAWYTCRWTNEDYHQCLKTGCQIEQRTLGEQPALERLLALCAPLAIHLLQLRDLARLEPERPASEVIAAEVLQVVAALTGRSGEALTMQQFFSAVASLGGYLGRKRDGPPGWKTLWRGW